MITPAMPPWSDPDFLRSMYIVPPEEEAASASAKVTEPNVQAIGVELVSDEKAIYRNSLIHIHREEQANLIRGLRNGILLSSALSAVIWFLVAAL
jgi:hypothetical protein